MNYTDQLVWLNFHNDTLAAFELNYDTIYFASPGFMDFNDELYYLNLLNYPHYEPHYLEHGHFNQEAYF